MSPGLPGIGQMPTCSLPMGPMAPGCSAGPGVTGLAPWSPRTLRDSILGERAAYWSMASHTSRLFQTAENGLQ